MTVRPHSTNMSNANSTPSPSHINRSPLGYNVWFTLLCGTIDPGSPLRLLYKEETILGLLCDHLRRQTRAISLHVAARDGRLSELRAKLCLTDVDVSETDIDGQTPVHVAAKCGQTQALRELLQFGGDANTATALPAVKEIIAELKARGLDARGLKTTLVERLEKARGATEPTELLRACAGRGPGYGPRYMEGGDTAVHWAAINGQTKALGVLLHYGGDPNKPGNFGRTAVYWAAYNRHSEALEMLEAAGGEQGAKEEAERELEEIERLKKEAKREQAERVAREKAAREEEQRLREEKERLAREKKERLAKKLYCRAERTLRMKCTRPNGAQLGCSAGAPVYLAGVSEYICAELLQLAGGGWQGGEKRWINVRSIYRAVETNVHLNQTMLGPRGLIPVEIWDPLGSNYPEVATRSAQIQSEACERPDAPGEQLPELEDDAPDAERERREIEGWYTLEEEEAGSECDYRAADTANSIDPNGDAMLADQLEFFTDGSVDTAEMVRVIQLYMERAAAAEAVYNRLCPMRPICFTALSYVPPHDWNPAWEPVMRELVESGYLGYTEDVITSAVIEHEGNMDGAKLALYAVHLGPYCYRQLKEFQRGVPALVCSIDHGRVVSAQQIHGVLQQVWPYDRELVSTQLHRDGMQMMVQLVQHATDMVAMKAGELVHPESNIVTTFEIQNAVKLVFAVDLAKYAGSEGARATANHFGASLSKGYTTIYSLNRRV